MRTGMVIPAKRASTLALIGEFVATRQRRLLQAVSDRSVAACRQRCVAGFGSASEEKISDKGGGGEQQEVKDSRAPRDK